MKKLFLLTVCFLVTTLLMAAPVTVEQARQKAAEFLSTKGGSRRAPAQIVAQQTVLNAVDAKGQPYLYAFNVGSDNGFVIVSGDDRFRDVLGYSASGTFSNQDMPDNMRAWLQEYVDEMEYYISRDFQQQSASATHRASGVKPAISPLLKSKWNQGYPYNMLCPAYTYGDGTKNCVTGCAATSMAQVMYYHKHPDATKEKIDGYTNLRRINGTTMVLEDIPAGTSIDWNNMLPSYNGSESDAQKQAVAKLMLYCGTALSMIYGTSSSATSMMFVPALVDKFGYDETATLVFRDDYSYAGWVNLMYDELAANRPVIYDGQSSKGGHSFVVDGYDEEDFFHINWGWGGQSDEYYALSVLNPSDNTGIGASGSTDGYSFGQDAVIGIQTKGATKALTMTTTSLTCEGNTIKLSIYNYTGSTQTFDVGFGLVDDEGQVSQTPLDQRNNYKLNNNYGFSSLQYTVTTDPGMAGQTLKIIPISKLSSDETWRTDVDWLKVYILVVYDAEGNPTLTQYPMSPALSIANPQVDGNLCAGSQQSLRIEVQNVGGEFYGTLYLFASTDEANKGEYLTCVGVTIPANGKKDVTLVFTPEGSGNHHIWVTTDEDGNNVIGESSIYISTSADPNLTILANSLSTGNLSLYYNVPGSNNGTLVKGSVSVKNNDTGHPFIGSVRIFALEHQGGGSFSGSIHNDYPVSIEPNGTTNINFEFDLPLSLTYMLHYCYGIDNSPKVTVQNGVPRIFECVPGMIIYYADGTTTSAAVPETYTVPSGTEVVDLRGVSTLPVLTPGDNKNCLYLVDEGKTLVGITDNVISGTTAQSIVLEDNQYGFFTPVDFTAEKITYTRTFVPTEQGEVTKWNTLVLPFAASEVYTKVGDKRYDLTWFQSASETNKNFWLMEFTGEDDSHQVIFNYVNTLKTNTPYIIALPGDSYGNKWSLTGCPITFEASATDISANAKNAATGANYKFMGTMVNTGVMTDVYVLNDGGENFVKDDAAVSPFRAYFGRTSGYSFASSLDISFGIDGGDLTGIVDIQNDPIRNDNRYYNLNGQQVSQPTKGLYIVNGKKVFIK